MRKSKTKETFEKALSIISDIQQNPTKFDIVLFLLRLASKNPKLLVSAYEKIHPESTLRDKIIAELQLFKKFAAIKLYKDNTGVGLKEAKEAVEKIAVEEQIPGYGSQGITI